jgi:hypothetical protein
VLKTKSLKKLADSVISKIREFRPPDVQTAYNNYEFPRLFAGV